MTVAAMQELTGAGVGFDSPFRRFFAGLIHRAEICFVNMIEIDS